MTIDSNEERAEGVYLREDRLRSRCLVCRRDINKRHDLGSGERRHQQCRSMRCHVHISFGHHRHRTRDSRFQQRTTIRLLYLVQHLQKTPQQLVPSARLLRPSLSPRRCAPRAIAPVLQTTKMAARKNPTTALPMSARPLPPLPKLRVRKPNKAELNPCIGIMSSVLGCWASSGYSAQGCQQLETSLRACMDARVSLAYFLHVRME